MKKLANAAAINIFEKVAEEGRSYPLSRIYTGFGDVGSLGINHALQSRAAQGRANIGEEGVSKAENLKLKAVADKESDKTYPISRFLTDPVTTGALGALGGFGEAARRGGGLGRRALMAGTGGLAGYMGTAMMRDLYARSDMGKANAGRTGFGGTKQNQLNKLRASKPDRGNYEEMDADTLKRVALSTGANIAKGL